MLHLSAIEVAIEMSESVTPACWRTHRKSSTITSQGFRKMGDVSVAQNGLAPVYIIGSHTPLSLSLSSILLLLSRTLEKDYGEATLSILVVFFILIFYYYCVGT